MEFSEFKEQLLRERGYLCESCLFNRATDLHHCLIRRDKRFPELDCRENLMIVCHPCHMSGVVDSKSARDRFWQVQCFRYGKEHMQDWLQALPLKIKPRFVVEGEHG